MENTTRKNLQTQSIIFGIEILVLDSKKTIQNSNISFSMK
jgi:hypothetical protein